MKSFSPFLLLIVCIACNSKQASKPPLPETIFSSYHSAVVLIKNEFLYKVDVIGSNHTYYFTAPQDGKLGAVYSDYDSACAHRSVTYGTGFFIDNSGIIATNRHVIENDIPFDELTDSIKEQYNSLEDFLTDYLKKMDDTIRSTETLLSTQPDTETVSWLAQAKSAREEYGTYFNNIKEIADGELKVSVVSNISIASDDNYNSDQVLLPCQTLIVSEDKDIDLALIQTNTHKLPAGVMQYIPLNNDKDNPFYTNMDSIIDKPLKINTQLLMIGYNEAGTIGLTSNGLKPQLTQGAATQESDHTRVLYSIPALHGSSGSPVFDKWGNLVAINYAGISATQNFNYGILATHLNDLYRFASTGTSAPAIQSSN